MARFTQSVCINVAAVMMDKFRLHELAVPAALLCFSNFQRIFLGFPARLGGHHLALATFRAGAGDAAASPNTKKLEGPDRRCAGHRCCV
jgi:hypothetical protein